LLVIAIVISLLVTEHFSRHSFVGPLCGLQFSEQRLIVLTLSRYKYRSEYLLCRP